MMCFTQGAFGSASRETESDRVFTSEEIGCLREVLSDSKDGEEEQEAEAEAEKICQAVLDGDFDSPDPSCEAFYYHNIHLIIDEDNVIYSGNALYNYKTHKVVAEGFGTLIYGANSIYESYIGEFKNAKFNGVGTLTFKNGASYKGYFFNGFRHGYGVYVYPKNEAYTQFKYEGTFRQGKIKDINTGILTFKSGIVFKNGNQQ